MPVQIFFLVVALVLFAMGAWSRWWAAAEPRPYYPTMLCGGLFFWTLSQLWPLISK
jgi:hypothetical protein